MFFMWNGEIVGLGLNRFGWLYIWIEKYNYISYIKLVVISIVKCIIDM